LDCYAIDCAWGDWSVAGETFEPVLQEQEVGVADAIIYFGVLRILFRIFLIPSLFRNMKCIVVLRLVFSSPSLFSQT
jgi:hypothetical protein